jgi:hypothetical protein
MTARRLLAGLAETILWPALGFSVSTLLVALLVASVT